LILVEVVDLRNKSEDGKSTPSLSFQNPPVGGYPESMVYYKNCARQARILSITIRVFWRADHHPTNNLKKYQVLFCFN